MIYLQLFISFMKISFCSFGGMTMVPIINDEVLHFGWMNEAEVLDIVAVAEMTPGSLGINCATFVGMRTAGIPGAFCASLGAMMPSLTLALVAGIFVMKLTGNVWLESCLRGIRPASIGLLWATAVSLSMSNYCVAGSTLAVSPNLVGIGIVSFVLLYVFRLSIPKTVIAAALMGLIFG